MFTETRHRSWFSRLGGGLKNIIFGFILLIAAGALLFWNEGRAVKTYKALKEGAGIVVSVPADKISPANDGKLVHVSGPITYPGKLGDPLLNISMPALRLKRHVEMLQWAQESSSTTKNKYGGGTETSTTYTYKKIWSPSLIDSSAFKQPQGHENPSAMPFEAAKWVASDARLGAFVLPASLAASLGEEKPVPLSKQNRPDKRIAGKGRIGPGGAMYFGSKDHDRIGDARITLMAARPAEASIAAMQKGGTFAPYTASNGREIMLARASMASAAEMFKAAQTSNTMVTWLIRLGGVIAIYIAFSLIFSVIRVAADVVPFFGSLVGAGIGIISLLLAVAVSAIIIAIAWLFFRPLLSLALLALAAAALWLARAKTRNASAPQQAGG